MPIRCSHVHGSKKQCVNPADPGSKLCPHHKRLRRESQRRARERRPRNICSRCGARPSLFATTRCGRCASYNRERALPHLQHDVLSHTRMVERCFEPTAQCSITGRSLIALRKIGRRLSVDRIDSTRGYVEGNMQLMADDLNSAKGNRMEVPASAINWLLYRMEHTVHDCHSARIAVHRD